MRVEVALRPIRIPTCDASAGGKFRYKYDQYRSKISVTLIEEDWFGRKIKLAGLRIIAYRINGRFCLVDVVNFDGPSSFVYSMSPSRGNSFRRHGAIVLRQI